MLGGVCSMRGIKEKYVYKTLITKLERNIPF